MPPKNLTIEDFLEIRRVMGEDLDNKINMIISSRLDHWFNSNIQQIVHDTLKEEFKKIMIVKFGE